MEKTKVGHTPGPWSYKDTAGAGLEIFGYVGQMAAVELPFPLPPDQPMMFLGLTLPQQVQIAYERWVQFEPNGWHEMQEANAKLIAAAPELLAACKAALEFADESDVDLGMNCWPELRAAIRKAEE